MLISVKDINIDVRSPHPSWCDFSIVDEDGGEELVFTIHHGELVDLLHEVKKAMRTAASYVGDNEVYLK